ncbi:MAG TPA: calcium-binding protein [Allosphingosinicella sp.]|jgi:Ca2+-binding RTX toxin-like protein
MATYTGTDNRDYLYGSAVPDTIYGRGGDDEIFGSGGSDWLYGEDGDDFISLVYSISPSDVVRAFGGADNDLFYIGLNGQGGGRLEADGGDGNDVWWMLDLQSVNAVLTLGQGRDSIRISGGYQALGGAMITVTDFATGDSGDRIEWDYYLWYKLAGWDRAANPFAAGYLRLVQSGSDTLLDVDFDGAAGPGAFFTLITFQNVTASALTAQNLGGYSSDGAAIVGLTLAGREIGDEIRGSSAGDLIEGLGGDDRILGALGDDILVGGDGNDNLGGEEGDDTLRGGIGNDSLVAGAGNDDLFGGEGDDLIQSFDGGTDEIYGEEGNDTIIFDQSSSNPSTGSFVSGGAGDDKITVRFSADGGVATFDAGEGADLVTLGYVYETTISVTLGAGIDRLRLEPGVTSYFGSTVIEDFAPEAGETIDWLPYIAGSFQFWDGDANPFGNGMARLIQDGPDTLMQVDQYGGGSWHFGNYTTIITFRNVDVSQFTAATMGGYAPDGSVPAALSLTGTVADERFDGGVGADTIDGAGGKDSIFGSAGHDTLRGGEGDDTLNGELGDDLLEGGDGSDVLNGGTGRDRLYGGEGDDRLSSGGGGSDHLYGEAGNDILTLYAWDSDRGAILYAGGGDGDDTIFINITGVVTVDGGSGSDRIVVQDLWSSAATLTLGAGRDTIQLYPYYRHENSNGVTVTDFVAGPDGDMVDWDGYLGISLIGWNRITNPFALGYVRLLQSGGDTLVQIDRDAGGSRSSFVTILTLKNVSASTLEAGNFDGFDPQAPLLVTGTAGADTLSGTPGRDQVDGGGGNDVLRLHQGGDDIANGGAGNDVFLFGATMDRFDSADGGSGIDQIALQGGIAFTFGAGVVGIESIGLLSGNDTRFGDTAGNLYSYDLTTRDVNVAAGAMLTVDGAKLRAGENLTFNGSAETDASFFVYGGRGVDTLTGGSKNDTFLFGSDNHFGAGDFVNGGAGIDQLALRGSYSLTFGAGQLIGIESIGLLSAQDTRYGALGSSYSYNLTMNDGNVAAGVQMVVDGAKLRGGETLVFNGAAETDGSFRIIGGANGDNITGSQNGDIMQGNGGADQLTGGGGADTFAYKLATDSSASAADHILDFTSGTDRIDLSKIDANTGLAGDQAFSWIGSGAFTNVAGQLRAYQSGSDWFVEGDVNGDGAADLLIQVTVTGGPPVQSDFLP